MDANTIFVKTAKAARIGMLWGGGLSSQAKRILSLVDGKQSVEQLLHQSEKLTRTELQKILLELEKDGYIHRMVQHEAEPEWLHDMNAYSIAVEEIDAADLNFSDTAFSSALKGDTKKSAQQQNRLDVEPAVKLTVEIKVADDTTAKAKREAERKAKAAAAEKVRREATEHAKRIAEAEARARQEMERIAREKAEAAAKAQAEEQARQKAEAERNAKVQAEERARAAAEQKARHEADERARLEAERIAREQAEAIAKAEEAARLEAERKAKAEEQVRVEAQRKAQAEAEERARIEAERKAQAEAAEQARLAAEQRAREEAEALAKIEAEKKAQEALVEKARQEAEEKARLEAERIAREQAEALAKAEEAAQLEAERKAKAEAEELARVEAERQAQVLAAEQARLAAEQRSREEAEALAKIEAERKAQEALAEKARQEAEEKVRLEAERVAREQAEAIAKAEEAARLEAERARIEAERKAEAVEQAGLDAERRAREDAEEQARIEAERKALAVAAEQAMQRVENLTRADVEAVHEEIQRAAEQASEDQVKHDAVVRSARKPSLGHLMTKPWFSKTMKALPFALPLVLVLIVALVHVMNLGMLIKPIEKLASASVGEPVTVSEVHAALFPQPRLVLTDVAVGSKADIKVGKVTIASGMSLLFDETKHIKSVELDTLTLRPAELDRQMRWVNHAASMEKLEIGQITLKNLSFQLPGVEPFYGKLERSPEGLLSRVELTNHEHNLTLVLTPQSGGCALALNASLWKPPLLNPLELDEVSATGVISQGQASLSQIEAKAYGGIIRAQGVLSWSGNLSTSGNFELIRITLPRLLSAFGSGASIDGMVNAKAVFSGSAIDAASLVPSLEMNANFELLNGKVNKLALSHAVMAGATAKAQPESNFTRFDTLTGSLLFKDGQYAYRQLALKTEQFQARGNLDIDSNRMVSGKISAELTSKTVRKQAGFNIGGELAELKLQ